MSGRRTDGPAPRRAGADLPLGRGPFVRLAAWMTGLMVFLAIPAMAGGMALVGLAADWRSDLEGSLTVELPADAPDSAVTGVVEVLRNTDGVSGARSLADQEIAALLSPWLGAAADLSDLPVPRLVTAAVDAPGEPSASRAVAAARAALADAVPEARLDDHGLWRAAVSGLLRLFSLVAWGAVGVVNICAVLVVVFAARGAVEANRDVIQVLHLTGATSTYIARQFQAHALRAALWGAAPAGLAGLAVVWMAARALGGVVADSGIGGLSGGGFSFALWPHWMILVFAAPAAALLAALTVRWTVLRALRGMMTGP